MKNSKGWKTFGRETREFGKKWETCFASLRAIFAFFAVKALLQFVKRALRERTPLEYD
jgi:hypothetical protein